MLHSIILYLSRILWRISWQVAILIVIIAFISLLSRKASANFRYWLWCIVLFRLCFPVNIPVPIGVTHHVRLFGEETIKVITDSRQLLGHTVTIPPVMKSLSPEEPPMEAVASSLPIADIGISLWFVVVIPFGAIILFRILYTKNRLKKCLHVTRSDVKVFFERKCKVLGIEHDVPLLYRYRDITDGPAVVGVFRPKIILPYQMATVWSVEELEPILLHEIVHIKRYDFLVNWLQVILQVIFFFHPLVWYANGKIRELREEVCDDIAIKFIGSKRKVYSRGILSVLEDIVHGPSFRFASTGFIERKSSLARRIIRITNRNYNFYKPLTLPSMIGLVVIAALTISIACDSTGNIMGNDSTAKLTTVQHIPENGNFYIHLEIIKRGEYNVEGVPATNSDLAKILKETIDKSNKKNIVIETNSPIPYEEIQYIIDIALSIGINYISVKE